LGFETLTKSNNSQSLEPLKLATFHFLHEILTLNGNLSTIHQIQNQKMPEQTEFLEAPNIALPNKLSFLLSNELEPSVVAFESSQTLTEIKAGYAKGGEAGALLTRGVKGHITFDMSVKAVSIRDLTKINEKYMATLSDTVRDQYNKSMQQYGGAVGSWWSWFGISANAQYERDDIQR